MGYLFSISAKMYCDGTLSNSGFCSYIVLNGHDLKIVHIPHAMFLLLFFAMLCLGGSSVNQYYTHICWGHASSVHNNTDHYMIN